MNYPLEFDLNSLIIEGKDGNKIFPVVPKNCSLQVVMANFTHQVERKG